MPRAPWRLAWSGSNAHGGPVPASLPGQAGPHQPLNGADGRCCRGGQGQGGRRGQLVGLADADGPRRTGRAGRPTGGQPGPGLAVAPPARDQRCTGDTCRELGVTLMAYQPLASGASPESPSPGHGRRASCASCPLPQGSRSRSRRWWPCSGRPMTATPPARPQGCDPMVDRERLRPADPRGKNGTQARANVEALPQPGTRRNRGARGHADLARIEERAINSPAVRHAPHQATDYLICRRDTSRPMAVQTPGVVAVAQTALAGWAEHRRLPTPAGSDIREPAWVAVTNLVRVQQV